MSRPQNKNIQLAVIVFIALTACAPRHDKLSQMVEQAKADNLKIITQMKSRTYELNIKPLSNSVSKVLSDINKSAKLLEEEIGIVESIRTGASVMSGNQAIGNIDEQISGKSFANTYEYKGRIHTLQVTARIRELGLDQSEVNLTFARTVGANDESASRQLPPGYTQTIYDKLWSAIERDL